MLPSKVAIPLATVAPPNGTPITPCTPSCQSPSKAKRCSSVTGGAFAVAVNVTCIVGCPATVAVSDCAPSPAPSVHVVCTNPSAPLVALFTPVLPPFCAANSTSTPASGCPSVAFTRTTMSCASCCPGSAVCASPLAFTSPCNLGATVIRTVSA